MQIQEKKKHLEHNQKVIAKLTLQYKVKLDLKIKVIQ
jgi:hypothetical protein